MNLFLRTLKSFSRKERWVAGAFLIVFLGSLGTLIFNSFFEWSPAQGRTYTEGLVGQIIHLNPVFTEFSEADADISSLIFSGLVKYNAVTGTFDEDLATHTLSDDHLTYTFTLKNDLYWQDGTEVSADDIYYTYATVIQSPDFKNTLLKANFDGVKIEEVNARTVSFTLNTANSFFFTSLTVGLLPKHILETTAVAELDTASFNQTPVGTGPYKVDGSYETNNDGSMTVNLSASSNYYGKKPLIEQLRFIAYSTVTDLIDNRSTWNGAARIRQSLLDKMNLTDLSTFQYELPQYTALFFNTNSTFLGKNKERLALSKAIDKKAILEAIGYKVQIDTPLLELNQGDWINTFNTKEAQGALHDAGWDLADGATVRTNEKGDTLSLRLVRRDFSGTNAPQEETSKTTAELIQQELAAVGVEVKIEAYNEEDLQTIILKRDYDMLLYGQSLGYNLDTFSYWHSSQATETGLNLSNYQSPSADLLIEKIRGAFDESDRQGLLDDLADTISKDVPAVFLYTPSYYYLVDTKVTGINWQKLLLPKDRFSNSTEWELH
jgi:peptide/nickel transport system substrate-binding protein